MEKYNLSLSLWEKTMKELDPRRGVELVKDPICQYIRFTKSIGTEVTEETLIQSRWIQRLKRIFQTQFTWAAYPGATHNRYQHSLGVMHLVTEFVNFLYPPYLRYAEKKLKKKFGEKFSEHFPEVGYVVETFRIAALLHDIGHGPFSHAFEAHYLTKYKKNHEDITQEIISKELSKQVGKIQRSLGGPLEKPMNPQDVLDVLFPYENGKVREDLHTWKKLLYKVLRGLYSVDKLDYLIRDSYYCGTPEFGFVDVKRLLYNSMLTPEGLALHKNALHALVPFLLARLYMFESVYYHRYSRALELSICDTIEDVMKFLDMGDPTQNLDKFWELDDFSMYSICNKWAIDEKCNQRQRVIGKTWRSALNGNPLWREAYYQPLHIKDGWPSLIDQLAGRPEPLKDSVTKALEERGHSGLEIRVDVPKLYVRPENPLYDQEQMVLIYDPDKNKIESLSVERLLKDVPIRFISFRIFARPEEQDIVADVCRELFPNRRPKPAIEM